MAKWLPRVIDALFPARLRATAVLPGGQIPITWALHWPASEGDPGNVTARVYLDQVNGLLWESPITPVTLVDGVYTTGQQAGLIETPNPGGLASDLYRIGWKELRADILTATGAVASATTQLLVYPEAIDNAPWSFGQITGASDSSAPGHAPDRFGEIWRDFIINHGYTIRGTLTNTAANPTTTFTGTIALVEAKTLSDVDPLDIETRSFTLPPRAKEEFVFAELKKNWTWLIAGIWVRNYSEPLSKIWDYWVRVSLSDPWGNTYEDRYSLSELHVTVYVSDEKHWYADAALAALGLAIFLAIFGESAGSGAGQVASGLGAKALDPPRPSPYYRSKIELPALGQPCADGPLADVARLVQLAQHAVDLLDAIGEVRDRIIGARVACDEHALALQRAAHDVIEERLTATMHALRRDTATCVARLRSEPRLHPAHVSAALQSWQRTGLPRSARHALAEAGCPERVVCAIDAALERPEVVECAANAGACLELLAFSLWSAYVEVTKARELVLAGTLDQP